MLADLPRSSASAIVRALKRHPQVAVPSQQGKRHKQISGTKKNGLDSYGIHGILFVTFLGLGQLGNLCRKVRENHWHPMVVPAIHDQCPCEYEPRIKRKPVDWVLRMVILPFLSFSFRKKIINPKFLKVFQSFRFQSHIFWPTNLEIWIQSFDHFPSDVTLLADGALERGSVDQTGALDCLWDPWQEWCLPTSAGDRSTRVEASDGSLIFTLGGLRLRCWAKTWHHGSS